jgi:hypothetical protein
MQVRSVRAEKLAFGDRNDAGREPGFRGCPPQHSHAMTDPGTEGVS